MATPKSKARKHAGPPQEGWAGAKFILETALLVDAGASLEGAPSLKLQVPDNAYRAIAGKPARVKALLLQYGEAAVRSREAGRSVSFRVHVDPAGAATVTPVEEVTPDQVSPVEETAEPGFELREALAAARDRGRLRAAEIPRPAGMMDAGA